MRTSPPMMRLMTIRRLTFCSARTFLRSRPWTLAVKDLDSIYVYYSTRAHAVELVTLLRVGVVNNRYKMYNKSS